MNYIRSFAAAFAAFVFTAVAMAAEATPNGLWKWTLETPNGPIEASVKLEQKDDQLSGTYTSPFGETKISKGSFQDGAVAFEVEREFDGNKFVVKYSGKIEGDAITGVVQLPGFDGGEATKMEWRAKRNG